MFALHLKSSRSIPPAQPEFFFHPTRKWRCDFGWPEHRLLVEIEGGTWLPGGGRHNRGAGFQNDCEKYLAAFEAGYSLLRFTTRMVKDLTALRAIERFFASRT